LPPAGNEVNQVQVCSPWKNRTRQNSPKETIPRWCDKTDHAD